MQNLVLSTETANGYTAVPDIFIDQFIPKTNGEFVKIYLYLLRLLSNKNNNLSISSLADTFNQTESDVIRALRYWDKLGLLELDYTADNTISGITLKDLNNNANDLVSKVSSASNNEYNINIKLKGEGSNIEFKPKTTAEALKEEHVASPTPIRPSMITVNDQRKEELSNDEDFSDMLFSIQQYVGRPLLQNEYNLCVSLHDTYGFSTTLIDYLYACCVEKNHTDVRYIEATALSWHAKNIKTKEAAHDEVTNHSNATISVLKAFGLSNRELGKAEKDYIEKWHNRYHFSPEIIAEACNRCIIKTHNPDFPYADGILKRWYDKGVKTFDDITKADAEFNATKKAVGYSTPSTTVPRNAKSSSKTTNNKFNNFQQREYSQEFYDSLYDNM